MRTTLLVLLLALLPAVGGCNQTLLISDPTARVVSVRVVGKSNEASAVRVTVELKNPNDIPLPLRKAHYTVELSGVSADSFSFDDQPARTLPASGRQTIDLAAVFPGDPTGAACHVSGWVTYVPPGEIRKLLTDSGIPLPSADFSSTGRVEPLAISH